MRFSPSLWWELMCWEASGERARLWWRDDDAQGPSPALDRLLETRATADAPLTLAVTPGPGLVALCNRLACEQDVTVIQHGVDHQNRREGAQAGEFPHDWSRQQVVARLQADAGRLAHAPGAEAVFAPPWNDAHPELGEALAQAGFVAWSAHRDTPQQGPLPRFDVHLDLLRWRDGPRFRGEARVLGELTREMNARRRARDWRRPIGLLTHHLDHDAASWRFLSEFLNWSRGQPALDWVDLPQLLAEVRTARAA